MHHDQVGMMHIVVQLGNGFICYHINRTREIIHMTVLIEGELHYQVLIFSKKLLTKSKIIDISLISFMEIPIPNQFFQ